MTSKYPSPGDVVRLDRWRFVISMRTGQPVILDGGSIILILRYSSDTRYFEIFSFEASFCRIPLEHELSSWDGYAFL